jgi:hypothetical protein
MRTSLKRLLAALTLSLAWVATAPAAMLAVDFQNAPIAFGCQTSSVGCNVGYNFQVTHNITVVSLGVFSGSIGNVGLNTLHPAAIWDANHTLIASATIDPSASTAVASASGLGSFLFSAITPLELTPGAYTIAAFYRPTFDEAIYSASASITAPGIVMGLPMQGFAASLTEPTTQVNTTRSGYFGPSFQIAAVPEPASAGLVAIGAACALLASRRRRSRRD